MKKQLLILLTIFLSFNNYAQISFEKGYYIDNSGQKIECLIKNIDWKNNPTEFQYKLSESADQKKAIIGFTKEFGIYNVSKYLRSTINIDRSSSFLGEMTTSKNPVFKQEQLFLRVLVEGNANLYAYIDGNLKRYFYKTDTSEIEQLIFKSFKSKDGNVLQNNRFKQQLRGSLKCEDISIKNIENVDYNKNEFVKLFVKYNECNNSKFTNFNKGQKKDLFNLSVKAHLNNSSLKIQNSDSNAKNTDFGNRIALNFGVEFEFILPFNKNKWAIVIEPTYQQFKSESEIIGIPSPTIPFDTKVKVEYSSIEVPIGIRHYMFLDEKSKLFLNAAFIVDFDSNSTIEFEKLQDLEINSNVNTLFGIGYKYNNNYSLELRYATSRDVLNRQNQSTWSSDYQSVSLLIGYTVL